MSNSPDTTIKANVWVNPKTGISGCPQPAGGYSWWLWWLSKKDAQMADDQNETDALKAMEHANG